MTEHSRISPSASKRWLSCPGSVKLLDNIKRAPAGDAAQQGTAMHTVSEAILLSTNPGADHKFWRNQYVGTVVDDVEITEDHMDYVLGYVEFACEYIAKLPGAEFEVEHKGKWHLDERLFGTIDLRIEVINKILVIMDLKTGYGLVDPETASQLWIYALIAAQGRIESYDEIHLVIYQPKDLSNPRKIHIISPEDLVRFQYDEVLPAIKAVFSKDPQLHAGEEQCQWCDAGPRCKALAEYNIRTAKEEFGDIDDILDGSEECDLKDCKLLTNEQIGQLLPHVDMIASWASRMFTYAQNELECGREIPGYKLVRGRSSRSWSMDQAQIIDYLTMLGIPEDSITETVTKLLTLPKTEKLFKRKKIDIDLQNVTNKSLGKLKMAHESDKRKAVKCSAAEDFKENEE